MNYFDKKSKLIENVITLKNIVKTKLNENIENLEFFETELTNLNFNVLCLGDFSSGKSTFINNFFLDNEVKLPVRATTTTAKLTIIKYGEKLQIIAVMKGGVRNEIKDNIEESLKELIAAKGKQLDDVEFVEVLIPSPILKEGVVIVDSPGLNDPETERMDVTYKFVNQADCVLYFLNAQQAWKNSEKEFLEDKVLTKGDLDKIFFLMNYWDTIEDEDDRNDLIEYVNEQIIKSINIAKEKLQISSIKNPPLIPISAKTGENFDNLKKDLFNYLGDKKSEEILGIKIKKYNTYIKNYIDIIQNKEVLLNKDKEQVLLEQKEQKASLEQYKIKSSEAERKIIKSIANKYDNFIDSIRNEYKTIISNFESNLRQSNIETSDDFKAACVMAYKKSGLSANDSMNYTIRKFKRDVEEIFDREKSNLNIPVNAIMDHDFIMAKVFSPSPLNDREKTSEVFAGGAGMLSMLSSAAIGAEFLMAPGVVTTAASSGALSSMGAWFTGTAATTTTMAGMSGMAMVGIATIPLGIIGVMAYSVFKNRSKEKFQKALDQAIDNSIHTLKENYDIKIKEIQQAEDDISSIISKNISNEFIEIYQEKLNKYNEAISMSDANFNVNIYKDLSQEINSLTFSC